MPGKGISAYADEFVISGLHCPRLGILLGTIRERRCIEALYGLYCFATSRPSNALVTKCSSSPNTCLSKFLHVVHDNCVIRCRAESVFKDSAVLVAGEYGAPGARIIYKNRSVSILYDPYRADKNVYHIHSLAHIESDLFYVTTGDTAKYLDVVRINAGGCKILKRSLRYTGGFTGSILMGGQRWFGTDFSRRPNYLFNLDEKRKYFLPRPAYLEYVVSLTEHAPTTIRMVTKTLRKSEGCVLHFDVERRLFELVERVRVVELSTHQ